MIKVSLTHKDFNMTENEYNRLRNKTREEIKSWETEQCYRSERKPYDTQRDYRGIRKRI